ncbi:hypothetical protein [Chondromyces apiculatus]|nr:hypothetical protein [Chondromyces apiculatus]
MRHHPFAGAAGALATALMALPAAAQDLPKKLEAPKHEYLTEKPSDRKEGLSGLLNVGGQLSISDNRSVLGQTDGMSFLFGFKLDSTLLYNKGPWEWRTVIGVAGGMARTPLIDEMVKARDFANADSTLLYHALPWFGPFVRVAASTTMFRGADVRPVETAYLIQRVDGTVDRVETQRLTMTDPFRPLTLKESIGPFAQPVTSEAFSMEGRAGVGARQSFARGQLALSDDAATPAVEVQELSDAYQIGAEASIELWGTLPEKGVSYRLMGEVLIPLAYSALPTTEDRGAFELANLALVGTLSFKLVEWASIDYELRLVREPLLVDKLQAQNNLLLSLALAYPEKSTEKK